jgi:hypothetical protein
VILGWPYGKGQWRAYDGNGNETHLDVIGPVARPTAPPVYRPSAPVEALPSDAVPDAE